MWWLHHGTLSATMGSHVCDVVKASQKFTTAADHTRFRRDFADASRLLRALCTHLLPRSSLLPHESELHASAVHTNGDLGYMAKLIAAMTTVVCRLSFWISRIVTLASFTQADQWKDAVSLVQSMRTNGYPPGGLLLSNVIAS